MRRWAIAGSVVALGCSFDAFSSGDGRSPEVDSGSSGAAETADDHGSPMVTASASGGATSSSGTSSSTTAESESATQDGTTTAPEPTTAPTTDPGESTQGETDATSGGRTSEHLQNTDQTACNGPFWCVYNANVNNPTGGPLEDQECFTSTLEPPFDLVEVNYVVYMSAPELGPFDLVVRRRGVSGPGAVIDAVSLQADPWGDEGPHTLTVDPPITIDDASFCVGFDANGAGLQSALGIAVDAGSDVIGTTWVDFDTYCATQGFVDVVADFDGIGEGNWCIDVVVEK